MDADGSGGLSFEEFKSGIKNLPGIPSIHMTEVDYDRITDHGKNCPENPQKSYAYAQKR